MRRATRINDGGEPPSRQPFPSLGHAHRRETAGALVSLLHAVNILHTVVPEDLRPGMTNRDVKRRGKEVLEGRWAPEAVAKAVQEATTAAMVAVTAATTATSS